MSDVWVVRNREGEVMRVVLREFDAVATVGEFGGTVTRETLLTPAQAAVIEAAKALVDADAACVTAYRALGVWARGMASTHGLWLDAKGQLLHAVTALRAQEEDA
jgi:hypothetical protein